MSDGNKIKVSASPCLTEQEMTDYIRQWLSPEQRNSVEKHLLECDLCSDAMEGLSMIANRNALDSLDELINKSISAEPLAGKGKLISMRLNYRTAAALALLVVAGGVLYFILSHSSKNEKMFSQNFKPYKNTDTIHTVSRPAMEESKASNTSTSKAEEKNIVVAPASTETGHYTNGKYVTKTIKGPSEQKQAGKEITTAMPKQLKDTASQERRALNNGVELGPVEVIGYKIPLIDKGNAATQTTISSEEIKNAATRDAVTQSAPTTENEEIAKTPPAASVAANARTKTMAAKKANANKQAASSNSEEFFSYKRPIANAEKDSSFTTAMKAYNQKQYRAAVQLFDDYLRKYPNDEKATFYDAVSNLSIDSAATALTQLEQVLGNEKSEFYDDANWYKALALIKLQRNKEAKTLLKKIKNTNSPHSDDAAKKLDEF